MYSHCWSLLWPIDIAQQPVLFCLVVALVDGPHLWPRPQKEGSGEHNGVGSCGKHIQRAGQNPWCQHVGAIDHDGQHIPTGFPHTEVDGVGRRTGRLLQSKIADVAAYRFHLAGAQGVG